MQTNDASAPKNRNKNDGEWNSEAEEALKNEERSLDIGESGQFAPGGYYNQQGVNEPRRTLDDDDIIPPTRNSR